MQHRTQKLQHCCSLSPSIIYLLFVRHENALTTAADKAIHPSPPSLSPQPRTIRHQSCAACPPQKVGSRTAQPSGAAAQVATPHPPSRSSKTPPPRPPPRAWSPRARRTTFPSASRQRASTPARPASSSRPARACFCSETKTPTQRCGRLFPSSTCSENRTNICPGHRGRPKGPPLDFSNTAAACWGFLSCSSTIAGARPRPRLQLRLEPRSRLSRFLVPRL